MTIQSVVYRSPVQVASARQRGSGRAPATSHTIASEVIAPQATGPQVTAARAIAAQAIAAPVTAARATAAQVTAAQAIAARAIAFAIALTALLLLGGCASKGPKNPSAAAQAATAEVAASNAQLPRFRIRDWSAPNDHTIIVIADDGTRYRAETLGPCLGLDFANRLAFVNKGGFEQVDRYSSVVLGDGTRCTFQSFDKLKAPESKALDSYEKSKEKDPKPADADAK